MVGLCKRDSVREKPPGHQRIFCNVLGSLRFAAMDAAKILGVGHYKVLRRNLLPIPASAPETKLRNFIPLSNERFLAALPRVVGCFARRAY